MQIHIFGVIGAGQMGGDIAQGVGDKESADTVMKLGMNHPMGPLALADLIGLDTCPAPSRRLKEANTFELAFQDLNADG